MEELTPEFFTSCGIEWRDDNPKQKECYEGDILIFIGGVEFTNTLSGGFGGEKNLKIGIMKSLFPISKN